MRSLLFFLAMIVSVGVFSQQLIPINAVINNDLNNSTKNKTMTCGIDTNGYLMSKATGVSALNINNATSAQAFCQYFDAPQNLTISGVDFYAWSSSLPTVPVTVNLYYANPLDSMPTGSVLASIVVNVDSTFGAGTLSVLKKSAVFPTPVTVNAPYVIEITNHSINSVSFVGSSYAAADGQGEWLCSLDIFGTWTRSYNVNVGGTLYDADFIVEPYITYDFTAGYDEPTVLSCYDTNDNIQFSEKHPLIENRMYSVAAFVGSPDLSYTWDFGDGSLTETSDTVQHTYSSFGTYTVIHTDTLFGFTSTCVDTTSIIITLDTLMADFSYIAIGGLSVNFTDLSVTNSTTGVISWFWDFGDGNTSAQQNPTHNYATNGTYTVCLIASNTCEADTTCSSVTVSCLAPNAAFSDSTNNLTVSFTDLSTQTPTSWFWDFGDGNTSTQQNPTHNYAANGTYTVCLIASNTCEADTTCSTVTVSCLAPNAAFSDSTNNLTVSFTDLSTQTPSSWFWDYGDGNTSTQQNPTHNYATNGTYTVCLIASNTCGSDTSCSLVTVSSTVGIADIENNVQIYPNPVQEVLNIDLQGEAIASIYSTDGKLVKSVMLVSGLNTIETAEMENGIYVLKIESTDSVKTYQFVKE